MIWYFFRMTPPSSICDAMAAMTNYGSSSNKIQIHGGLGLHSGRAASSAIANGRWCRCVSSHYGLTEVGGDLFHRSSRGWHKMIPVIHAILAPLREDRRLANGEEAQQTDSGCASMNRRRVSGRARDSSLSTRRSWSTSRLRITQASIHSRSSVRRSRGRLDREPNRRGDETQSRKHEGDSRKRWQSTRTRQILATIASMPPQLRMGG